MYLDVFGHVCVCVSVDGMSSNSYPGSFNTELERQNA